MGLAGLLRLARRGVDGAGAGRGGAGAGQAYLRGRGDTVRCIVMGLTDDSDSELFNELRAAAADTPR